MFERHSETMNEIAQAIVATIAVGALLAIGLASIHHSAPRSDQALLSPLKEQLSEPAS